MTPPSQVNRPHKTWPAFFREFFRLAGPFWTGPRKWKALGLLAGMAALTVGQVWLLIQVNHWSKDLFDSLEARSMDRFVTQTLLLLVILVSLMAVNGTHLWVKRRIQLKWRYWLSHQITGGWMNDGRHYKINYIPGEHDNPDGRIAEDIRITTETAIDLAHSLFYCILLLVGFTQILWSLSGQLPVQIGDRVVNVPGHMVGVALLYAGVGSAVAFWLGRPLIRAVDKRQTAEANFRFSLVRAREHSEAIALLHGEEDERRRLIDLFRGIRWAWHKQTNALMKIFMFSSVYSVLSTAFPFLVTAPRYIAGTITLGAMMQTAQAFQQTAQALSWPVDNIPRMAEWRASVERVLALAEALERVKNGERAEHVGFIDIAAIEDAEVLDFADLTITSPGGNPLLAGFTARIEPGERVLITGDPATAVKLFKVVAGIWPWGTGTVQLPGSGRVFFMPQRPYLPIEPLRDALCYPAAPGEFDDALLQVCLQRVGLGHLGDRLSDSQNWEQNLTAGEQQRLGFARLLLTRPSWIFIQEATDALDPVGEKEMMRLLQQDFPQATVLTVGYHGALAPYHSRMLTFEKGPDGHIRAVDTHLHPERHELAEDL